MSSRDGSRRVRWFISCAVLLAAVAYLQLFTHGDRIPLRRTFDTFPTALGGWKAAETVTLEDDVLQLLQPSDYLVRRYQDDSGRAVWLYIGYWQTQRKGAEIHSPKNCLPGGGWEPLEAKRLRIDVGKPESIEVNRYVLQKGPDAMMVLYWYESQGRSMAGELSAKLELVRNSIIDNRSDGAIVRISSPVYGSIAQTSELLGEYAKSLYPVLGEFLPG